jgi:histidinol-phosphate aminotransferase
MNTSSISRRRFAQLLGVGAAAAVARPALSLARSPSPSPAVTRVVRLSSNENPYGPSPKALKAVTDGFDFACRYPDDHADLLVEAIATADGVSTNQVLLGAGSGEILRVCATAFTGAQTNGESAGGTLVVADPTFEAIVGHAQRRGAEVVKVPLTGSYAHDLAPMAAAAKRGLIYVCNPNNPTASLTPKTQLREFITSAPRDTMILVDEAYHHYVESPDYESVIPLIEDHPNLIVARTFSKIYGMAGMRCGYAIAQPEVIERMRPHALNDAVNITALIAAAASLDDPGQVTNGRRLNNEARALLLKDLGGMGYEHIPSHGNFVMIDLKRPVTPLIQAMRQRNVMVGRLFPALPNHMRITIGKKAEMQRFLTAFREVTAAAS